MMRIMLPFRRLFELLISTICSAFGSHQLDYEERDDNDNHHKKQATNSKSSPTNNHHNRQQKIDIIIGVV